MNGWMDGWTDACMHVRRGREAESSTVRKVGLQDGEHVGFVSTGGRDRPHRSRLPRYAHDHDHDHGHGHAHDDLGCSRSRAHVRLG